MTHISLIGLIRLISLMCENSSTLSRLQRHLSTEPLATCYDYAVTGCTYSVSAMPRCYSTSREQAIEQSSDQAIKTMDRSIVLIYTNLTQNLHLVLSQKILGDNCLRLVKPVIIVVYI